MVYAFSRPHFLNPQIGRSPHRGLYRRHVLHIVLRGPALCLLAAGFSWFFYPLVNGGGVRWVGSEGEGRPGRRGRASTGRVSSAPVRQAHGPGVRSSRLVLPARWARGPCA